MPVKEYCNSTAAGDYIEWVRRSRSFDGLQAWTGRGVSLASPGETPDQVQARIGTPGFITTHGFKVLLGRDFVADEGEVGKDQVIVLTHLSAVDGEGAGDSRCLVGDGRDGHARGGDELRHAVHDRRPARRRSVAAAGAAFNMVTPEHYKTFGIPIQRGRAFTAQDSAGASRVAIVNDAFVRRHLDGLDPLKTRLLIEQIIPGVTRMGEAREWQIVGVYPAVRNRGPRGDSPRSTCPSRRAGGRAR